MVVFISLFITACNNQSSQVDSKENKQTTQNTAATESYNDGQTFVEGGDYSVLQTPYDTENKEQVVVYEFFGYACSHCFTFEPYLDKWLENKPDHVKLVRVPMNFHPSWADYQLAYLTAEVIGVAEEAHAKLFDAIHNKHQQFNSIDDLAKWYAKETGTDKDVFISTSESFILDSKLTKADNMGFRMKITSTPTLVINGKFKAVKAKNRDDIMKILDFLIEKEAKLMGLIE